MAYITVTEFDNIARDVAQQGIQAPMVPAVAEQQLDVGLTAKSSEPFKGRFICVYCSDTMSLAFGREPVADGSHHIRGPGEHWYGVNQGDRVSAVLV